MISGFKMLVTEEHRFLSRFTANSQRLSNIMILIKGYCSENNPKFYHIIQEFSHDECCTKRSKGEAKYHII